MTKEKLAVIFPIEMIARELDYRLILASLFAKPHHQIFMAQANHANRLTKKLRGGLYVGKHIAPTSTNIESYHRAKENGFVMVHLSEEGAIFMGDESHWGQDLDLQLDPNLLSSEDQVA